MRWKKWRNKQKHKEKNREKRRWGEDWDEGEERRGEEKVISNIEETWRQDGKRKQSGQNKRRWEEEMRRDRKKWEEMRHDGGDEIDEMRPRWEDKRWDMKRQDQKPIDGLFSSLSCIVMYHSTLRLFHTNTVELRWSSDDQCCECNDSRKSLCKKISRPQF